MFVYQRTLDNFNFSINPVIYFEKVGYITQSYHWDIMCISTLRIDHFVSSFLTAKIYFLSGWIKVW